MAKAPAKQDQTKNELATVQASSVPAHLQNATRGSKLQDIEASDIIVPRIKLLQGISPEVAAFDDAQIGNFWLNVLDVDLGPKLRFIPLSNRKRYLLLPPMNDDRGVLARADDGKTWNTLGTWDNIKFKGMRQGVTWEIKDLDVKKSGLGEFGTSIPGNPDSNPAATLFYEYLVWLPDMPELTTPVLLSLARSQSKKARDLNGKIEFSGVPMQGLVIEAGTCDETGAEGPYKNYQFSRDGYASEEQFDKAVAMAERFANVTYAGADEAELSAEAGTGPVTGDADSKEF